MSAINELEGLRDYEGPVDEEYIEPSSGFAPLPPGTHLFTDTKADFEVGKPREGETSGYLQVVIDAVGAAGSKVEGMGLNFNRFSARPYYRGPAGVRLSKEVRDSRPPNTSQLLDWLKAKGFAGSLKDLPRLSTAEGRAHMQQLVESLLPVPYKMELGWDGYCSTCGETVFGSYSKFPDDGHGGKKFTVPCPKCGTEVKARNAVKNVLRAGA